jgi:hypothetical protein
LCPTKKGKIHILSSNYHSIVNVSLPSSKLLIKLTPYSNYQKLSMYPHKASKKIKMTIMLHLFRCKMVSVVKYFRRNQFQKKLFSRKYFSAFGSHEKITKSENATVSGIRQRPVDVAGIRRACLAGSGQNCRIPAGHLRARSDPAGSRQDQWPDPVRSGRIPAGFCPCRIPAAGSIPVVGFRRRHYSRDLMMPDSGAAYFRSTDYCRIRPFRYQTCV